MASRGLRYHTEMSLWISLQRNLINSIEDLETICFRNPLKLLGMDPDDVKNKFAQQLCIKDGTLIFNKKFP